MAVSKTSKKAAPKVAKKASKKLVKKAAPKKAVAKKPVGRPAKKATVAPKKAVAKKAVGRPSKKAAVAPKKAAKGAKKNKLGVKNSLVNNINAKKEKGTAKPKSKSSVSKKAYKELETNWGKKK